MQQYPMTPHGAKQLEDELARLKGTERPKVILAISEARSHGDISENSEYDAAREKQAFIEGRIAEIEQKLSRAHVIDSSKLYSEGRIIFGATVTMMDLENEEKVCYQIVGDDEADLKLSKISVNSPVAKSLIGKEIGSVVEVRAPIGIREYEILDFSI